MGSNKIAMPGTWLGVKPVPGDFPSLSPPAASRQRSTTPLLHYSITPFFHDSLQLFPPFPSVWCGGRWPPSESGRAERTECEHRLESILRIFGCRASAREPRPIEGGRVEGATRSCPRDFPVAEHARKAKETQRTMKTGRSTRNGIKHTTKNQGASPPAHSRPAWRVAMCLLAWLGFTGVGFAQTVVWSENFDDGNGDNRWYADFGVWQIGTPTVGPGSAHSTPYCAGTGLTANYADNASSRLIRMQSFTVPAASQYPRLRFWQWYSFANSDYGVVEVSTNNGTTWSPVRLFQSLVLLGIIL